MKREEKWEMLRAISCISIVLLHVAALYTEDATVYQKYMGIGFSSCDFLQIITRTAVPCFVMLSGAFMLNKPQLKIGAFYKSSIRKLVFPTLFFEIFYMAVSICSGDALDDVVYGVWTGSIAGHLWFMFMLMGLYAVFPILLFIKQRMSQKEFVFFSCSMVVFSCLVHFTFDLIWPLQFFEFLGYFLIANCIRNYGNNIPGSAKQWLFISFFFLLITFALNEQQFYYGTYNSAFYRNPNFPTVILASLAIFIAFSKLNITHVPGFLLEVAKHSLLIYMLHQLMINILSKIVKKLFGGMLPHPIFFVPLAFIVCFAMTYVAAIMIDEIKNILKRIM